MGNAITAEAIYALNSDSTLAASLSKTSAVANSGDNGMIELTTVLMILFAAAFVVLVIKHSRHTV